MQTGLLNQKAFLGGAKKLGQGNGSKTVALFGLGKKGPAKQATKQVKKAAAPAKKQATQVRRGLQHARQMSRHEVATASP